jgi:phage I-like protein
MSESDQLELVALLSEHAGMAEDGLSALDEALNPEIDANPNDKLLMEMLDVVSDAQESLRALRDLLQTMEQRDLEEIP